MKNKVTFIGTGNGGIRGMRKLGKGEEAWGGGAGGAVVKQNTQKGGDWVEKVGDHWCSLIST